MPSIMCRVPVPGRPDHDLVEDRQQHVEPFDREARLPGEGALQEALEHFHLRDAVEERFGVRGIERRKKRPDSAASRIHPRSAGTKRCAMSNPVVEQ
jgi:hypothetical protein